jgi:hypothetical protein
MFIHLYCAGRRDGEVHDIRSPLALSHFAGVLLNVPRLIHEGTLRGPARKYVNEVTGMIHRVLLEKNSG